ncbi:hypothetical protein GCM10009738_41670 [Kitasatospora viridis]
MRQPGHQVSRAHTTSPRIPAADWGFPIVTRTCGARPGTSEGVPVTGLSSPLGCPVRGTRVWGGIRLAATAVEEKVKAIIIEQLGITDEGEVTPSASFVDDLGADSLDTVELVMAFEEGFDIEIPDEDAEKIRTVRDAVEYIDKHAKGGK